MQLSVRHSVIGAGIIAVFSLGYYTAAEGESAMQQLGTLITRFAPQGVPQHLPMTRNSAALDPPPVARRISPMFPVRTGEEAPLERARAQALARRTFIKVSGLVHNYEPATDGQLGLFFLHPSYRGWPGLCQATAITVYPGSDGGINSTHVYRVVGPFESPSAEVDKAQPGYDAYKRWEDKIDANCAARNASSDWFTTDSPSESEGRDSFEAAKVFDDVIAAARAPASLPFALNCEPATYSKLQLCADARKFLASTDPRDIARVGTRYIKHIYVVELETKILLQDAHVDGTDVTVIIRSQWAAINGVTIIPRVAVVTIKQLNRPIIN